MGSPNFLRQATGVVVATGLSVAGLAFVMEGSQSTAQAAGGGIEGVDVSIACADGVGQLIVANSLEVGVIGNANITSKTGQTVPVGGDFSVGAHNSYSVNLTAAAEDGQANVSEASADGKTGQVILKVDCVTDPTNPPPTDPSTSTTKPAPTTTSSTPTTSTPDTTPSKLAPTTTVAQVIVRGPDNSIVARGPVVDAESPPTPASSPATPKGSEQPQVKKSQPPTAPHTS